MANNPLLQFRVWGGFLAFGIFAGIGVWLLYRGIRGEICDESGKPIAGRGWFIGGGIFCLLPLTVYAVFVWKQGYFGS